MRSSIHCSVASRARLVGVLTRAARLATTWRSAEDAVQDALVRALQTWPVGGVPEQPDRVALPGGAHAPHSIACGTARVIDAKAEARRGRDDA